MTKQHCLLLGGVALSALIASSAAAQAPAAVTSTVDEVVVTGTRLTAAGFNAPTPVTVLGSEALQKRNPATMAEAVNELPSFRVSGGPSTATRGLSATGQIRPDLRGLGYVRTLTLLNGRRYAPASADFTSDMAGIPTSLVERVDVVTGGASAAYGSDAVAGVVNFVLNNKLNGFKGGAQYGISQQGDGEENIFNLGYGGQIGERFHFIIGGDFAKDKGAGNFYERDLYKQEVAVVGFGTTRSPTQPAQGFLGGVEVIYPTGGIITAGPLKGTAFTNAGDPYAFGYGTVVGGTNMVGSTANYGKNPYAILQMRHPFERHNYMLQADYKLTDKVELFTEMSSAYITSKGGFGDTYTTNSLIINATNPFIPASVRSQMTARGLTNITVGRLNEDVSPWYTLSEWLVRRYLAGARGDVDAFGSNWRWDAFYSVGRTHFDLRMPSMPDSTNFLAAVNVVTDANGNPVCGPVAANPNLSATQMPNVQAGCVPFNVFGQRNSQAAIDYVQNYVWGRNVIHQDVVGFNISGTPYALPAGDISLAFGAEMRKESVDSQGDVRSQVSAFASLNQGTYSGKNSVKEAYVEVGVPLIKDMALIRSLDLNGAVRRTDYKTSGAVTTWKVGATWEPTDFVRLRATQSRDIRAPNISELFAGGSTGGITGILNPANGQVGRTFQTTGGNANLKPEIADSFTAGVVLQPKWGFTQGLRASVDYYHIKIQDVIGAVSPQDTILRCFNGDQQMCANIDRDNTVFGIALVRANNINFAKLETEGLDIEIAYQVPLNLLPFEVPGRLNIRNLTTIVSQLSRDDRVQKVDLAGFSLGGVDKLTGNVSVDYDLNKFAVGLQAKYFGDLHWDPALVGPDSPYYKPTLTNSISRNLFPGQVIFNFNASYDLIDDGDRTLQLYTTINNIFDRQPSVQGAVAFNISGVQYYDTIGRYVRVGMRFTF